MSLEDEILRSLGKRENKPSLKLVVGKLYKVDAAIFDRALSGSLAKVQIINITGDNILIKPYDGKETKTVKATQLKPNV